MNKVFYVAGDFDGCYFVRCLLPLQANGWDGTKTSLRGKRLSREQEARGALDADVVVFQRPTDEAKLNADKALKQLGKKIVFENDDTFKVNIEFRLKDILEQQQHNLNEFIRMADLVTTSTEYLANEYRELNGNVVVLPNTVNPIYFSEPIKNKIDKVRIGLIGSVGMNSDSEHIKDVIASLANDKRVQLVLFSLPPKEYKESEKIYKEDIEFWNQFKNIEWQPLVPMEDYFETLNNLAIDIVIIPRADNYFNRCKSNIKFLEASMFELPVIAQGFEDGNSPYQADIKNYVNGIVVTDNSKWLEEINGLIENKEVRERIGKNAKLYVLDKYTIKGSAHLWKEAYNKLF